MQDFFKRLEIKNLKTNLDKCKNRLGNTYRFFLFIRLKILLREKPYLQAIDR